MITLSVTQINRSRCVITMWLAGKVNMLIETLYMKLRSTRRMPVYAYIEFNFDTADIESQHGVLARR